MKHKFLYFSLSIIIATLSLFLSACGSDNNNEPDSNQNGSDERTDLCELLHEELVRTTFGLSADVVFDKTDKDYICMYEWTNEDMSISYSVSLNFAHGGQRDDAAAQAVWESQNDGVYKDKNLEEISGIGDQASWSSLGGGQLRVLHNGYIFYVSLSTYVIKGEGGMTKTEMIEKATTIADAVIDQM